MDLGVPLSLITAGKFAAANLTSKRLLACVSADVCRQVVAAAEVTHADAALKGLLACVDANVTSQLIRAREATVAGFYRTSVRPLMWRGLAGPRRVLAHAARPNQRGLGTSLRGKGFDGGQRSQRRLAGLVLEGLLVWGN